MTALVALQHSILTTIWHMLTNGETCTDAGSDYFIREKPAQIQIGAIHQLEALGYTVTLETRPAP